MKKRGETPPEDLESAVEKPSGVFEGDLNEKSDSIDALNIGVEAEEKSIKLYRELEEAAEENDLKQVFRKLIHEEQKHLAILNKEIDFVTETGEYYDFTAVSM